MLCFPGVLKPFQRANDNSVMYSIVLGHKLLTLPLEGLGLT